MGTRSRDLVFELGTWAEGGVPALDRCVEPIRSAVDADECVACEWGSTVAAGASRATSPAGARLRDRLRAAAEDRSALSSCASCPLAAGGAGVLARDEVERVLPAADRWRLASALAAAGFGRAGALRAVLAPDGEPLACVAVLRATGRFGPPERRRMEELAAALGARCAQDRRLGEARFASAAMAAALEVVTGAAFVVAAHGEIVHANGPARELLERDGAAARDAVRAAARGCPPTGASVTRIAARGMRDHLLLVLPPERAHAAARAGAVAEAWRLTPRQAEVLERIARGEANKEIASAFGLSEATVEAHVTALLQKAGADSRSRLIARYWGAR